LPGLISGSNAAIIQVLTGPRSLSDSADRSEHGGRASTEVHDIEAHKRRGSVIKYLTTVDDATHESVAVIPENRGARREGPSAEVEVLSPSTSGWRDGQVAASVPDVLQRVWSIRNSASGPPVAAICNGLTPVC
jgi:hypothetical protein